MKDYQKPQLSRPLFSLEVGEFENLISEIVEEKLRTLQSQKTQAKRSPKDELVPRLDLAQELKISTVTLDKWVKYGQLPQPIKQGGRIYFRRSDLDNHFQNKGGNGYERV